MELLKTRKRVSEPEVRFFMVQIIGAIKYLHSRRVIHRDLKLGNIFFDPDMNLKIGDFGLASVLPSNDSRKYTICGTPNYIAPEVLGGKQTGHSFEVDIWAIGIMMYALLIGKPPFQAKDVNVIYERIKKTEYYFPEDKPISDSAKFLIKDLLSLNPLSRPTIDEILDYDWFKGPFPDKTREISLQETPEGLYHISKTQSSINFKQAKKAAEIYTPKPRILLKYCVLTCIQNNLEHCFHNPYLLMIQETNIKKWILVNLEDQEDLILIQITHMQFAPLMKNVLTPIKP